MTIKTFGNSEMPTFLFFYGACTHWSWYHPVINLLSENYYVIVPLYDGYAYDKSNFHSVEKTVADVVKFLQDNAVTTLDYAYGLSMGGAMLTHLLSRNIIRIEKAVIDAGMTPYSYVLPIRKLIALKDLLSILLLRSNISFIKLAFPPERWVFPEDDMAESYLEMQEFLKSMSYKTIFHTFESANYYRVQPIETSPSVEYWYGSLEKKARKNDVHFIKSIFKGVAEREIPDLEHGELAMMKPKQFIELLQMT